MANVQSVDRSLSILEALAQSPKGIGLTELANKVNLAKSSAHRLLATLINKGYVVQNRETDEYLLGLKIIELSSALLENLDIRTVAKKTLEELCSQTNEVVHLCIHENGEVVYIDKFESDQTIRMHSRIGKRTMMHSTGVGKVLLSGMTADEVRSIIKEKGMVAFTPNTITQENVLFDCLEKINKEGYTIDEIENEEGIRCIAAPIYDYSGKIIAAISISGPENRVTKERIQSELIDLILQTADVVSKKMGYLRD